MQAIELEGDAIYGVGPHLVMAAEDQLPTRVFLGRIRPKAQPACLRLAEYLDETKFATGLPPSINRRDAAAASLSRMYKNDQLGCCVISGKMHNFGVWSANDSDSGGIVLATDEEVVSQYRSICGPGDRGCNIASVLDVMRSRGLQAGGKMYKIDGYVSVDWTSKEQTKAAQFLFGSTSIGFDLPSAWRSTSVWEPTNSRIVGGHDVSPIDYDDKGVYVSSWGRIYLMTWEAWTSRKWISEYYAILAPLWYGDDGKNSTVGLDAARLRSDLAKLGNGQIPEIEDPEPPGPDVPSNAVRLLKDTKAGRVGNIVFGSDMAAGDYDMLMLGDGPPPAVP